MNNIDNQYIQHDTHCWSCRGYLSYEFQDTCPLCGWIICPVCDTCAPHCNR